MNQPGQLRGGSVWRHVDDLVNVCMLGVIAIVLVVQVFSRYVLNYSLGWTTELAGILLGWLMFLGAPAMLKRHSHMEIFLFGSLGRFSQRAMRIMIELVCGVFYAIVLVGSIDLIEASRAFETPALAMRGDFVVAVVPIGSAYLVVRTVIRLVQLLRDERPVWIKEGD